MKGIKRIHIASDWEPDRIFKFSRLLEPTANKLYRDLFQHIGMPLLPGCEELNCTKEEAMARYDYQEGIDVLLYFENGHKATLQEKFLDFPRSTATFTEKQKQKPGAWYTCTAQYWFVGYARKLRSVGITEFQDWMLIDLPALHRIDASQKLPWVVKDNNDPSYKGITFRYLYFDDVPFNCIVARFKVDKPTTTTRPGRTKQMVMPGMF